MYKEERDVLKEETRVVDECDMEKFRALSTDRSGKTIDTLQ